MDRDNGIYGIHGYYRTDRTDGCHRTGRRAGSYGADGPHGIYRYYRTHRISRMDWVARTAWSYGFYGSYRICRDTGIPRPRGNHRNYGDHGVDGAQ